MLQERSKFEDYELLYHGPTRRVFKKSDTSVIVEAFPEVRKCVTITNQNTTLRGSIGRLIINDDDGTSCGILVSSTLDITGEINLKWISTPIVGGNCDGRIDTTRERLFLSYDTSTYSDSSEFSAVSMDINITQVQSIFGVTLADEFRFYTGHRHFAAALNANQDFNLPNKNMQQILIPGGPTTGIKTFNLASTCLYPKEKTEFRICISYEEANNTTKQGVFEVFRFYPKLTYTVELDRLFPFWLPKQ